MRQHYQENMDNALKFMKSFSERNGKTVDEAIAEACDALRADLRNSVEVPLNVVTAKAFLNGLETMGSAIHATNPPEFIDRRMKLSIMVAYAIVHHLTEEAKKKADSETLKALNAQ